MIIPCCFTKVFKLCPLNPMYYKFYCKIFLNMSIMMQIRKERKKEQDVIADNWVCGVLIPLVIYCHLPYFPTHKTQFFPPNKCDLNSTCVLCAEDNHYFQNYEVCLQIMRSGITACERLPFVSGIYPNVCIASHVIPGICAAAVAKCSRV
jgi:hypothetical protein